MGATESTWAAFTAQEQMLQTQARAAKADAAYWKETAAELARQVENLKLSNVKLRQYRDKRVDRLADELRDANRKLNEMAVKVAAWNHCTGDDCERIAVCEAEDRGDGGLIWLPVLSSSEGLRMVAEEMLQQATEEPEGCTHCLGTGEGQHEGQSCAACGGHGSAA